MLFQKVRKTAMFPTSYCRILLLTYVSFNSVICLEIILVLNIKCQLISLHPKLLSLHSFYNSIYKCLTKACIFICNQLLYKIAALYVVPMAHISDLTPVHTLKLLFFQNVFYGRLYSIVAKTTVFEVELTAIYIQELCHLINV